MAKKYSLKFWFLFWTTSIIFLAGWFLYWNAGTQKISETISNVVSFLPIEESQKKEYGALITIGDYFLKTDGKEKTLLILFQNNMEIRPGGGFIGAFGIVKVKNGKVISMETHDLSNFDGRIPNTVEPPYPMRETLRIGSWKLRDSNYSPDFETNAKKAEEFYYMGKGEEKFDGVVGITANMLVSMLKVTGPVEIEGYPGVYDSENALISLEYQVEKAFEEQGIERGERKSVINDLAKEIEKRIFDLSASQKMELAKILLEDLDKKDIQLYFKDPSLQEVVQNAGWSGNVDRNWNKDFLMTSDANLGAFKSDYYMKRSMDYTVDFAGGKPTAHLKITYEHTAKQKDWMTRDYLTYLRVYVPNDAWFIKGTNFDNPLYGNEFGKKYFGQIVKVPIGTKKTVELTYSLPENIQAEEYALKIQKQPGINGVPVSVHVVSKDGQKRDYSYTMNSDIEITD